MALSAVLIAAAPVDNPPLVLHYDAYGIGGLRLFAFDIKIAESVGTYRIAGSARTEGFLGWFSSFAMRGESDGALAASGLQPSFYETTSQSHGQQRLTHLEFHRDGSVAAFLSPPEESGHILPSAEQTKDTIDPLSAILVVGHQVMAAGRCGGRVSVFDGRRRYDLVLSDDGIDHLRSLPGRAVGGETRRCLVDFVRLAGFGADPRLTFPAIRGRAWLAPPQPCALALPVRVEFPSNWGHITVEMAKAEITR